jgi:hypothetical protein
MCLKALRNRRKLRCAIEEKGASVIFQAGRMVLQSGSIFALRVLGKVRTGGPNKGADRPIGLKP